MEKVSGILKSGHQVASGMSPKNPYEKGTIEMQLPFFQALGLDLSNFFFGTLNIDIAPYNFRIIEPSYTFRNLKWHSNYPAEDFSFSPCQILFQNFVYKGLVYYPHPETKIGHFQNPSIVEVIAPHISHIKYGDTIEVALDSAEIVIF